MINSTIIRQKFMPYLFVKFSFFSPFRFRVDNARVFQRASMNVNVTVRQAACRLLCRLLNARWLRPAFAESYRLLRVNQARELVIVRV